MKTINIEVIIYLHFLQIHKIKHGIIFSTKNNNQSKLIFTNLTLTVMGIIEKIRFRILITS